MERFATATMKIPERGCLISHRIWKLVYHFMTRFFLVAFFFVLSGDSLRAQQSATPVPASQTAKIPITNLPFDREKLSRQIRESYYHPDDLSGLDCTASIDWEELFKTMKAEAPPERLKLLQGMTIQVHAVREKPTEFQFAWSGVVPSNRETLENGARQMISGFFQMYWSFSNRSIIPTGAEIKHVERKPTGQTVVDFGNQNMSTSVTVSEDFVPIHFAFDGAAMKGSLDPTFLPSPNPVPGDLRRLASVHANYVVGATTINATISMEYQTVGGINIPSRAIVGLTDAYSVPVSFPKCSVTKEISLLPDGQTHTKN